MGKHNGERYISTNKKSMPPLAYAINDDRNLGVISEAGTGHKQNTEKSVGKV
jgi:hypothetical protein